MLNVHSSKSFFDIFNPDVHGNIEVTKMSSNTGLPSVIDIMWLVRSLKNASVRVLEYKSPCGGGQHHLEDEVVFYPGDQFFLCIHYIFRCSLKQNKAKVEKKLKVVVLAALEVWVFEHGWHF